MEVLLNDEQKLLKDSAQRLVERHGGPAEHRTVRTTAEGFNRARLEAMGEAGWLALLVPEEAGGLGMGVTELAIVLEESGRGLLTEPVTALAAVARAFALGEAHASDAWFGPLLAGTKIVLPAFGRAGERGDEVEVRPEGDSYRLTLMRELVPSGADAEGFLVNARTEQGTMVMAVPRNADGLTAEDTPTVDGMHHTRIQMENVRLDATAVVAGPNAGEAVARDVFDHLLIGVSAEMLGIMEQALDTAIDYLNTREQFGRPIGSFQALQHRAVDDHIKVELTRSLLYQVCAAVDQGRSTRAMIAALKARASSAVLDVCKSAIQMHGAIGFTDEHDIGLYLRRAMTLSSAYGNADAHRKRFAGFAAA